MKHEGAPSPWDVSEDCGPPRPIALSLLLRMLFGTWPAQAGLFILGFGGVFLQLVLPQSLFDDVRYFRGELIELDAVVLEEDHGIQPGQKLTRWPTAFAWEDAGGQRRMALSWGPEPLPPGRAVRIESPIQHPDRARILGHGGEPIDRMGMFVTLPILLLGSLITGIRLVLIARELWLLRYGRLVEAKVLEFRETNWHVNGRTLHALTLSYPDEQGVRRESSVRTTKTDWISAEELQPMMVHPKRPQRVVLLNALPGRPRCTSGGCRVGMLGPWVGWLSLVFALVLNLALAYAKFAA